MTAITLPGYDWRSILRRAAQKQRALMALSSPLAATRQVSSPLAVGAYVAPSGPTVLIHDEFTDADATLLTAHAIAPVNTPGNSWTNAGGVTGHQIGSNHAVARAGSGSHYEAVNSGVSDCTVSAQYNVGPSNVAGGIHGRYADISHHWLVYAATNSFILYEANGGFTSRASTAKTFVANTTYLLTLVMLGTALTATVDGGSTLNYTSATFLTNKKHGIRTTGIIGAPGTSWLDEFKVTVP